MTIDDLLQPILDTTRPLQRSDSKKTVATWDSLAQINIIAAIEDAVGTELSTEEVLNLKSVESIFEICRAHGVVLDPIN